MFRTLNQIVQVTWMNLLNIPQRWGTSLVVVVGIAGVVGVMTAMLSMSEGFKATLGKAGHEDRVIVMRTGATSELSSGLSREQADLIKGAAGVRKDADGKGIGSAEILVIADLPKADSGTLANAAVRGVQPESFLLRPEVKIVDGRRFEPGPRELIVGAKAAKQFANIEVGREIEFRDSNWKIVGIFEAGGSVHESEFWADAEVAQAAYRRNGFQSVSLQLESKQSLQAFKDALSADPRLQTKVQTMKQYYADQAKGLSMLIGILGSFVGIIMGVGAVFGALNTMYAAVSTRTREIATLRAIGFGSTPVVLSVMCEALVLALIGGVLGSILAYVIFNGYTAATLGANFSQVAFDFKVTPGLMIMGLIISLIIGFIGGLLPALSAALMPVAKALRQS